MEKAVTRSASLTIRASHNFTLGDISLAFVSWFAPGQIAIVNMDGNLIVISVDERTCREFGGEEILFQQRILERYPQSPFPSSGPPCAHLS
jgi:hypothetical protein